MGYCSLSHQKSESSLIEILLFFRYFAGKVAAVANSTRCFWNKVDEMDGKAALHIEAIAMPVEWII